MRRRREWNLWYIRIHISCIPLDFTHAVSEFVYSNLIKYEACFSVDPIPRSFLQCRWLKWCAALYDILIVCWTLYYAHIQVLCLLLGSTRLSGFPCVLPIIFQVWGIIFFWILFCLSLPIILHSFTMPMIKMMWRTTWILIVCWTLYHAHIQVLCLLLGSTRLSEFLVCFQ